MTADELNQESLAADLERFIRKRFQIDEDDTHFGRETDVWEEGYVDSAGVVEVLAFIEDRIGERVPEDLLFEPEFVSVSGMARLVCETLR